MSPSNNVRFRVTVGYSKRYYLWGILFQIACILRLPERWRWALLRRMVGNVSYETYHDGSK